MGAEVEEVAEETLELGGLAWNTDMTAVRPDRPGEERAEAGVVGNLVLERNLEKKFEVRDTPAGREVLGPLSGFRPGTITVHTLRYPEEGKPPVRESVTAWTSRTKLRSFQVGDPIRMRIEAHSIRGETVWVVRSLKLIFT